MTEDDDVQTGRKQTLCQKYDINASQLDFKYVQECKNTAQLERILKVLRSNELGHYEKLQEVTEERLRLLAPNSRVLLTPEPVSSWNDLNTDQKDELTRDFLNWQSCEDSPSLEALKKEVEEKPRNYPAVRNSGKASIPTNEIQAQPEKPAKSCVPRSYESWDNFNVEKELSLVDRPDELKDNEAIRANNLKKKTVESEEAIALQELGAGDGHLCSSANDERLKGNEFFREQDYAKAIHHYNRSITLAPTAAAHSNRALCYIRTRSFEEAVKDCIRAQELNPNDQKVVSKALYHQSSALKELGRYQEAYEAIQNALIIDPNDKSIQDRANRLRNCMRNSNDAPKVRMTIEERDSRRRNPLIEEIAQKDEDAYYPFTCGTESVAQSDIGTARLMCLCSGVPPFIAKLRSGEGLPSSNRLCLRKTRSKKCFSDKNSSNRRKKPVSFTNGEIIEKDTIEDVEKGHFNVHSGNLLDSLKTGDFKSILDEMKILTPPEVCKALDGRLNPGTLNLCVKALCAQPAEWNFLREHLVALSQLPQFRASVKSLDRATKEALSARIGSVEESGQRVSDVVTRYELNGALPPPS